MVLKKLTPVGLILAVLCCMQAPAQITFSEVMYDVATNEYHDEFVEIFNLSQTDSADVTGWYFSDGTDTDELIPVSGPEKIPPRSFALILDGSYFDNSTVYDSVITSGIPILAVSDNSLGSGGLSNTNAEYLSITNSTGDTLTTYRYSLYNLPGYSDEKIDLDGENSINNWMDSRKKNGTPGRKNSVSPAEIDVGFNEGSLQLPLPVFVDDSVNIALTIHNYGLQTPSDSVWVQLFFSSNDDWIYDEDDSLIGERKFLFHADERTLSMKFYWETPAAGEYFIAASINLAGDANSDNNNISSTVTVLTRETTLHINEIKFITRDNEPEWLEVFNSGDQAISLKGWGIADLVDTSIVMIHAVVNPGEYKILAAAALNDFYAIADSQVIILVNFPSLNNQQDRVALLSPGGGWEEIVNYKNEWLAPLDMQAVSLERINPVLNSSDADNWGPSADIDGATPCRRNSLYTSIKPVNENVDIRPNPFSPDNDGFDDVTVISGSIPASSATVKIRIYDIKGRLIRTLVKDQYSGGTFDFIWDGKDDHGRTARIGIYIVFVEALNSGKQILWEFKTTVVLAQRLN